MFTFQVLLLMLFLIKINPLPWEILTLIQCILLISFKIALCLPIALKFKSTLYVSVKRKIPTELKPRDQMVLAAVSSISAWPR